MKPGKTLQSWWCETNNGCRKILFGHTPRFIIYHVYIDNLILIHFWFFHYLQYITKYNLVFFMSPVLQLNTDVVKYNTERGLRYFGRFVWHHAVEQKHLHFLQLNQVFVNLTLNRYKPEVKFVWWFIQFSL